MRYPYSRFLVPMANILCSSTRPFPSSSTSAMSSGGWQACRRIRVLFFFFFFQLVRSAYSRFLVSMANILYNLTGPYAFRLPSTHHPCPGQWWSEFTGRHSTEGIFVGLHLVRLHVGVNDERILHREFYQIPWYLPPYVCMQACTTGP